MSGGGDRIYRPRSGFTIVELLIVIVVIAILAIVTLVAYNGIQSRAAETALRVDMTNAAKKLEIAKVMASGYPAQFPSDTKTSGNVGLALTNTGTTSSFCINGYFASKPNLEFKYDSANGGVQSGLCSGAVIPGSEIGALENIITDPTFSNLSGTGWYLNLQVPGGMTITTRPGTPSDPLPNSPVLVLTNVTSTSQAYAMLQSSAIDLSKIKAGKSYVRSFYARKTNATYAGEILLYQVSDPSFQNAALSQQWVRSTTTAWGEYKGVATAERDGGGMNVLYQPLGSSEFSKTGWAIEFQGYRLYQQ